MRKDLNYLGSVIQMQIFKYCRNSQIYNTFNADIDKILKEKYRQLKKRNTEIEITLLEFISKFHSQEGKCLFTNQKMSLGFGNGEDNYVCSLDRINNNDGYTDKNTVFVCKKINPIKNALTLEEIKLFSPAMFSKIEKHQNLKCKHES